MQQQLVSGFEAFVDRRSVFKADSERAAKYAEAVEYWPGKFSEHALIGERLRRDGHTAVLDSGGTGSFRPFLPGIQLSLANPRVNGMDATDLPFVDDSFDAGISTHTLEHIPPQGKERMITELVRVSRRDVYMIFPFGEETVEVDDAKTRFVGNTHQHDEFPRITPAWLSDVLERHGWQCQTQPILNRAVHFMLAMLLPIDSDPKRAVCRWINERFDVTPGLGDPYNIFLHIKVS